MFLHTHTPGDATDPRPTVSDTAKEKSMSLDPEHAASASGEANGLWSESTTGVQPDSGSKSSVAEGTVGMPVTGTYSSSLLDDVANFINEHLRAFRAIPWVLGGMGALLVIRYTHMVRGSPSLNTCGHLGHYLGTG